MAVALNQGEKPNALALRQAAEKIIGRFDFSNPNDAINNLHYLFDRNCVGESLNIKTIDALVDRVRNPLDVMAAMFAVQDSEYTALDALPLSDEGKVLVEAQRLKALEADRNSLNIETIVKFARHFRLNQLIEIGEVTARFESMEFEGSPLNDLLDAEDRIDNYDDEFGEDFDDNDREVDEDPDESADEADRWLRVHSKPEGETAQVDEKIDLTTPLNYLRIQEALENVRIIFPQVRMELALLKLIEFATEQVGSHDLVYTLNKITKIPEILEVLVEASGGIISEDGPDEEDENASKLLTTPQVEGRLDTPGEESFSISDLKVRIGRLLDGTFEREQYVGAQTPNYHYRPPISDQHFQKLNPLLLCGITPGLVRAMQLTPIEVVQFVERNLKALVKHNEKPLEEEQAVKRRSKKRSEKVVKEEPAVKKVYREQQLRKVLELSDKIFPGGFIDLEVIRHYMDLLPASPDAHDLNKFLEQTVKVGEAQVTEVRKSRMSFLEALGLGSSKRMASQMRGVTIELTNESAVLAETTSSEIWRDVVSEIQTRAQQTEGLRATLKSKTAFAKGAGVEIFRTDLRFLGYLEEAHRLKLEVSAKGTLKINGVVRPHEHLLGVINLDQTGFQSFLHLLEQNGFTAIQAKGLLPQKPLTDGLHGTANLQHHLDAIPLSDFRRILRFLNPSLRSDSLLFSLVTPPQGDPYVRLVGRIGKLSGDGKAQEEVSPYICKGTPLLPEFEEKHVVAAEESDSETEPPNAISMAGFSAAMLDYFGLEPNTLSKMINESFGGLLAYFRKKEGDGGPKYRKLTTTRALFVGNAAGARNFEEALSELWPKSFRENSRQLRTQIGQIAQAQRDIESLHQRDLVQALIPNQGISIQNLKGQALELVDEARALDLALVTSAEEKTINWDGYLTADEDLGEVDPVMMAACASVAEEDLNVSVGIGKNGEILRLRDGEIVRNPTERLVGAITVDERFPERFHEILKMCGLFTDEMPLLDDVLNLPMDTIGEDGEDNFDFEAFAAAEEKKREKVDVTEAQILERAKIVNRGYFNVRDISSEKMELLSMHMSPVVRPGSYLISRTVEEGGKVTYHLLGKLTELPRST